nr:hypothetical protein [Tanacetum cinerariifolium]
MDEGTNNYSFDHIFAGSNPSVLVDKTKYAGDGLKTTHTDSGENKESRADDISLKVKLEDLSDILKDTRSTFFTPDSPPDEPIISQKEELEQAKAKAKAEVASMKAKPSYPDINQLTELLRSKRDPNKTGDIHFYYLQFFITEFLNFPSQVSSVQEKLKTLDSLPSILHKVTNTLNRFATMMKNASGATSMNVPSAGKASASHAEGRRTP